MRSPSAAGLAVAAALLAAPISGTANAQPAVIGPEACAPCHGEDGISKDREVPHLAGQNAAYLVNQLRAFRSGRRPHRDMRGVARPLTDQEIDALAGYYAALPPR